ncbi:ribosome biogenesis protein BRX1 homolog [Rhodnius prolixus]|uniref:Ribosome biogenesis protein BRX1 homolog n=2 Tax=Rhodnius TaxID=13248 RepID=T1I7W4_RHOPR
MSKKNRKTKLGRVLEKRKREESGDEAKENDQPLPPSRVSDEPIPKKSKWINRQRVLVFAARGTTQRDRHLMNDLKRIMPHSKPENKISRREHLAVINELCKSKNCNKSVFFEGRKKQDLYMWVSNVPEGPSAKFLIESVFTMQELRLTGNCLKGSRPLLSFDENFQKEPHYALIKELFIQVFGVPNRHPKSQPFIDRVISFTVLDNRIWYRHYQILKEDGALAEIGPRFVFNPIKIFDGSFTGNTLWDNPHYVTPNMYRRRLSAIAGQKYVDRRNQKLAYKVSRPKTSYPSLPEDDIFEGDTLEKAAKVVDEPLPPQISDMIEEPVKKKLTVKPHIISFRNRNRLGKKEKPIDNE